MRAVVQRVSSASVVVDGQVVGQIGAGLLAYVGAAPDDSNADVRLIADKIANLRIFNDEQGKLNRSVQDVAGGVLVISAFSTQADARKGRRPSFNNAAPGEVAEPLVESVVEALRATGLSVATGRFAAHMDVSSVNDGPICVLVDSRKVF